MTQKTSPPNHSRLHTIREQLASAIVQDAVEAQGPIKHNGPLIWTPKRETFAYKMYRGHEYAKLDASDSQVVAYFVDGDIYVTHHGFSRSQVYKKMIGLGVWNFSKYPSLREEK